METIVNMIDCTITFIDPTLQEMAQFWEGIEEDDFGDFQTILEWSENL